MVSFRTTDNTRWGAGKGSNLTATEVDLNFWDLLQRLIAVEANPAAPVEIANFTVTGSQMTVHMADGTEYGPLTLPTAIIRFREDWTAATNYFELDLVTVPDDGLYLVLVDHVSDAAFDPVATDGSGNLLYRWLLPLGASSRASISDEGALLHAAPTDINFAGAGVVVSDDADGTVTVTIGGGGAAALNDLSDVALVAPAAADYLRFDGAAWVDAPMAWADIPDKPATFPPSAHTHPWGDVTGKPTTFPPDAHTHPSGEITDFAEALDDRVAALLLPGDGINLAYDDAAGSLTISLLEGAPPSSRWRLLMTNTNTWISVEEIEFKETAGGVDLATGGVATASSTYSTQVASRAFDDDPATAWQSNTAGDRWIEYDFGTAVTVGAFTYTLPGGINDAPGAIALQRWDGAAFVTVQQWTGLVWVANEQKSFAVDPTGIDAYSVQGVAPSAFVLTLLDDADAAAARTTLGVNFLNLPDTPGVFVANAVPVANTAATALVFPPNLTVNPVTGYLKALGGGYVKNGFLAMPGQGSDDVGMTGLYDRDELTLATKRGTVTATITGAGTVAAAQVDSMFDAAGGYGTVSGTDGTTTKIEFVVDMGASLSLYGLTQWQPYVQYRLTTAPGGVGTCYKKITVAASDDGVTWYEPTSDVGAWKTTDVYNDGEVKTGVTGLWMGRNAGGSGFVPGNNLRYIRFTLEDRQENAGYASKDAVWIVQMGLRHLSGAYARQFLRTDGGEFYGGYWAKAATGGSQGAGTINATAVYDDGTLLCAPIEEVVSGSYDPATWEELAPHEGLDVYERMKAGGFDPASADSYAAEIERHGGVPGYWNKAEWAERQARTQVRVDRDFKGEPVEVVVEDRVSLAERHERLLLALDLQALAARDLVRRNKALEQKVAALDARLATLEGTTGIRT